MARLAAVDAREADPAPPRVELPVLEASPEPEPPPVPPLAPINLEPAERAAPDQVALWRGGRQLALVSRAEARAAGLFLLDIGRGWVPAPFRSVPQRPHRYEASYVALANAEFADTPEGRRAERHDRYLELYGIPPTPSLLRERLRALLQTPCARMEAPQDLRAFSGVAWAEGRDHPDQPVDPAVVSALQERLRCAGHLRSDAARGLDWRPAVRWRSLSAATASMRGAA